MLSNSSPRSCCILHSHKQCMRVPIYLHPKSIEKCGTFGFFANVMGEKRVSQYNLYFSYPELNWIFFHMFKGHLHFVSLLIFSPFFSRVFGFFFLKVLYMPGMIINGKYFSFFFFFYFAHSALHKVFLLIYVLEFMNPLPYCFWISESQLKTFFFFFISRIWRNSPHSLLLFVWIHFFDSFEIVVWCEELNNFFDLHYLFE